MYPVCHKTAFVMDESTVFVGTPSQQPIDYDVVNKSRQPQQQSSGSHGHNHSYPAITKSLWTCCVESVAEYSRIVWDIYPDGDRLITYVRNNSIYGDKFDAVLSWSESDQNLAAFSKSMISTSREAAEAKYAVETRAVHPPVDDFLNGLRGAIRCLGILSDAQKASREKSPKIFKNNGRIICISYFRNDSQIVKIQEQLVTMIEEYNQSLMKNKCADLTPVDHVNVVFINTYPLNDTGPSSLIRNMSHHLIRPFVSCEVHSTKSGTYLSQKLTSLVLKHYSLASTTVTGIPMKEEQNASSSANYDVEIFHPEAAHLDLYKIIAESLKIPKEGVEYETLPLKWCTPRSTTVELQYSTIATRITPVDVNSRPSSCLTNFLLSGRTVMLEMPKTKSSKIMSHMLCSHNSELYIHTICSSRSILEDPPSISEGTGGRVTDYRINDFGEFMKQNQLSKCKGDVISSDPSKPGTSSKSSVLSSHHKPSATCTPSERSIQHLERQTIYWPIVLGHTIMFNIQSQIQSLIELIPKETLTLDEVNQCKNAIYNVISMESKSVNLPAPTAPFTNTSPGFTGAKGKGPKREELYKILYKELAHYISSYAVTPEHRMILATLNELHSGTSGTKANVPLDDVKTSNLIKSTATNGSSASALMTASSKIKSEWSESGSHHNMYENLQQQDNSNSSFSDVSKVKKSRFSFDQTPGTASSAGGSSAGESLLSLWKKRLNYDASRKHVDFAGRLISNSSNICPLYVNLNQDKNNDTMNRTTDVEMF